MDSRRFDIDTAGLRDFRRDLKRLSPELDKQLRGQLRRAVVRVVTRARTNAPKVSGDLARSYRPFVTQRAAGIRSRLPYAPIIEYGGTIAPRGESFTIDEQLPVTRAVLGEKERVVEDFGDAVDRAARTAGWKSF
jgi:hypothetical protein